MTTKARSTNRTVLAMAALGVLASLALFGGAEAAFLKEILPKILEPLVNGLFGKGAPTDAIMKVVSWFLSK